MPKFAWPNCAVLTSWRISEFFLTPTRKGNCSWVTWRHSYNWRWGRFGESRLNITDRLDAIFWHHFDDLPSFLSMPFHTGSRRVIFCGCEIARTNAGAQKGRWRLDECSGELLLHNCRPPAAAGNFIRHGGQRRHIRKCGGSGEKVRSAVLSRGVRPPFGPTRKSSPWGSLSDSGLNQSINQEWQPIPTTMAEALRSRSFRLIDWLIDDKSTLTWLVYWIRTARSVFTGAGLKWPNTAGQYSASCHVINFSIKFSSKRKHKLRHFSDGWKSTLLNPSDESFLIKKYIL